MDTFQNPVVVRVFMDELTICAAAVAHSSDFQLVSDDGLDAASKSA